jgi:hypothetical protein
MLAAMIFTIKSRPFSSAYISLLDFYNVTQRFRIYPSGLTTAITLTFFVNTGNSLRQRDDLRSFIYGTNGI